MNIKERLKKSIMVTSILIIIILLIYSTTAPMVLAIAPTWDQMEDQTQLLDEEPELVSVAVESPDIFQTLPRPKYVIDGYLDDILAQTGSASTRPIIFSSSGISSIPKVPANPALSSASLKRS